MSNNGCELDKKSTTNNLTTLDIGSPKTSHYEKKKQDKYYEKFLTAIPSFIELKQYIGVFICGLTLWGTSWLLFKKEVLPGGFLFSMCGVVIVGYIFGQTLERYTTINPVVGMTLIGALYRNFGPTSFLQNPVADVIDFHLRRVYPVIILTRGPLGWNWEYIKHNSVKVFSLATLPWLVECLSTTFFAHILLDYPWYWGLHLGSILASVSPAVVAPTALAFNARGLGVKNQIGLLVANAGGLDTAFTEGMCGIINSAIFYPALLPYRIVKGTFAIVVGIILGVIWGVMCDYIPDHSDIYAPAIRSLLIFSGGLLLTYAGGFVGWGGVSGVAIMVCAGAAATRWARRDWPINNNPVSEVYKVLWRIFEPMLFTLSGYYLEVSQMTSKEFSLILGCLLSALLLRLLAAFMVALANDLSIKESIFIAVTWIPKAIVEAVLVRVAADSLWSDATQQDKTIASQHSNIIVIAILITSTLGSVLTTSLGPLLLAEESRVGPADKVAPTADKSVHSVSSEELKTNPEFSQNHEKRPTSRNRKKKKSWYTAAVPSIFHYTVLFILGLLVWGWLWISWGEGWRWDGRWFRIVIVVVTSWASGVVLNSITTLPPLVASLLTGILARNLGYLDMRDFTHIDIFFRKIYPVIILGKGSLGWDTDFMMVNWKQISALGIIPWTAEVATLATSVHFFLGHPWIWGLVLGTFYASVTFPVVMPNVIRIGMSPRRTQNWPQLVATAGGIDTTLSVGVYGVLFGYLFSEPGISDSYRYFKAFSALFIGVVLGVVWGRLAGLIPHSKDTYVIELRVLFVLFGGIFLNFATTYIGWGGVATVAVLACNATAARYWAKKGWILNKNPASTAYRVIWSACEPTVFAFTGTFIVIDSHITSTLVKGFGILVICLTVRLAVAALMCWNLTAREKAFMCCVWSTKSIVEAVLCPTAINMLLERESSAEEMRYAEDFVILTVQEILVTTPVAFLLTRFLGPILIKDKKFAEGEESHA